MWKNWSNQLKAKPARTLSPTSEEQISEIIKQSKKLRVVGKGYSFSPLVPTSDTMMDILGLSGYISHDDDSMEFWAGTTLSIANKHAIGRGKSLPIGGEMVEPTLGGIILTGSHNGANLQPCLASFVNEIHLIDGLGKQRVISKDSPDYHAAVISLGMFGVVTKVNIQTESIEPMIRHEYALKIDDFFSDYENLIKENRSLDVRIFLNATHVNCQTLNIWTGEDIDARRADEKAAFRYGQVISKYLNRRAILTKIAPFLTDRVNKASTNAQSNSKFYGTANMLQHQYQSIKYSEMEYAIPLEFGLECLSELLHQFKKQNIKTILPLHIKTLGKDDFWLSPLYGRESMTISVHQHIFHNNKKLFKLSEEIFLRYEGRPHWGKINFLEKNKVRALYPRFDDFVALRKKYDPMNKFLNKYLAGIFE